jgi:transcriptional regulator with XRE-family HTH domain
MVIVRSEELRKDRELAKLTLAQAANLIHVDPNVLDEWEDGKKPPDLDKVIELREIYQTRASKVHTAVREEQQQQQQQAVYRRNPPANRFTT